MLSFFSSRGDQGRPDRKCTFSKVLIRGLVPDLQLSVRHLAGQMRIGLAWRIPGFSKPGGLIWGPQLQGCQTRPIRSELGALAPNLGDKADFWSFPAKKIDKSIFLADFALKSRIVLE